MALLPDPNSTYRLSNGCIVYVKTQQVKAALLQALPWHTVKTDAGDEELTRLRSSGCRALDM
jgi:hypothetical protein